MLKFGLINLAGEFVLDPEYDVLYPSDDGGPVCVRAMTEQRVKRTVQSTKELDDYVTGGWRYVWLDGTSAFEGDFEQATGVTYGLACVKKDGRRSCIDWSLRQNL